LSRNGVEEYAQIGWIGDFIRDLLFSSKNSQEQRMKTAGTAGEVWLEMADFLGKRTSSAVFSQQ
jgi:hypothetical protein